MSNEPMPGEVRLNKCISAPVQKVKVHSSFSPGSLLNCLFNFFFFLPFYKERSWQELSAVGGSLL